jgi:hypothetical protein
VFFDLCHMFVADMKKKSANYPSKTLFEAKDFIVSLFEKHGDSVPLEYADLAKYGNVPLREAPYFASTASQYGWTNSIRGKGVTPKSEIAKAFRRPQPGEEAKILKEAFVRPEIYRHLISYFDGKEINADDAIVTYLIRELNFTDKGAAQCASVFMQNAKTLGVMDSDNTFRIDADITVIPPTEKLKKKEGSIGLPKKQNPQKKPATDKATDNQAHSEDKGSENVKNIPIFMRGKKLYTQVFEDMTQADWDDYIEQIQTFKSFTR